MIISLTLTNFKNYQKARLPCIPGINFFVGLNGTGKTNLLDAIHYLGVTRSFVNPQDRYNVRHGQEFFRIEGHIRRADKEHNIVAKVQPGKTKEFLVDGNRIQRMADHIGFMPIVILAPKDHILVGGGSAERRKFLDFYLCQTDRDYLTDLSVYNRQLSQRNAVLKEHGTRVERRLLDTYTDQMEGPNARIAQKRQAFVERLRPAVQALYDEISDHRDTVELEYRSDFPASSLKKLADQSLQKDMVLGRTTRGVHKDDMRFDLEHYPVKRYGSQGQVKSYLVALHLSLYHYLREQTGVSPVLLMDDIFDKLDDERVRHLVEVLAQQDYAQVFITDAREQRIVELCRTMDLEAAIIQVEQIDGSSQSLNFENFAGDDQEE